MNIHKRLMNIPRQLFSQRCQGWKIRKIEGMWKIQVLQYLVIGLYL